MKACDWKQRLNGSIYEGITLPKRSKIEGLFRAIYSLAFKRPFLKGETSQFTFFLSYHRKDYETLFEEIYNQCPYDKAYLTSGYRTGINWQGLLAVFTCWKSIKGLKTIEFFPHADGSGLTQIKLDFLTRLTMRFRIIGYNQINTLFDQIDFSGVKACVTLCDVWGQEILFVQQAQKRTIATVTAQHGIFVSNSANPLNYTCLLADTILVWGKQTEVLIKEHSPDTKIIICGQPVLQPIPNEQKKELFGIAMDLPSFKKYNQDMLNIVQELARKKGFRVKVRLHPTDTFQNYIIDELAEFDSNLNDCEVIFGHTTSMLFSYRAQGKKVLRYESDIKLFLGDIKETMCFSSLEDAQENLQSEKADMSNYVIDCIGDESKQKYKIALEQIFCAAEKPSLKKR